MAPVSREPDLASARRVTWLLLSTTDDRHAMAVFYVCVAEQQRRAVLALP
jgi:hypothetical protein